MHCILLNLLICSGMGPCIYATAVAEKRDPMCAKHELGEQKKIKSLKKCWFIIFILAFSVFRLCPFRSPSQYSSLSAMSIAVAVLIFRCILNNLNSFSFLFETFFEWWRFISFHFSSFDSCLMFQLMLTLCFDGFSELFRRKWERTKQQKNNQKSCWFHEYCFHWKAKLYSISCIWIYVERKEVKRVQRSFKLQFKMQIGLKYTTFNVKNMKIYSDYLFRFWFWFYAFRENVNFGIWSQF